MVSVVPRSDTGVERWSAPATTIADHGDGCCAAAREWLIGSDRARGGRRSGLSRLDWPRRRWEWGPVRHPIHWCDLDAVDELDCGSLAAIGVFLMRSRGFDAKTVQLVQHFTTVNARHWHRRWSKRGLDTRWINDELVYHEACGVLLTGGRMRIWDPTDAVWIGPEQRPGYASTVAVRIPGLDVGIVTWGRHRLAGGWTDVAE